MSNNQKKIFGFYINSYPTQEEMTEQQKRNVSFTTYQQFVQQEMTRKKIKKETQEDFKAILSGDEMFKERQHQIVQNPEQDIHMDPQPIIQNINQGSNSVIKIQHVSEIRQDNVYEMLSSDESSVTSEESSDDIEDTDGKDSDDESIVLEESDDEDRYLNFLNQKIDDIKEDSPIKEDPNVEQLNYQDNDEQVQKQVGEFVDILNKGYQEIGLEGRPDDLPQPFLFDYQCKDACQFMNVPKKYVGIYNHKYRSVYGQKKFQSHGRTGVDLALKQNIPSIKITCGHSSKKKTNLGMRREFTSNKSDLKLFICQASKLAQESKIFASVLSKKWKGGCYKCWNIHETLNTLTSVVLQLENAKEQLFRITGQQ